MMWRRLRWVGGWGAVGGDMVGREKEPRREESTDEERWVVEVRWLYDLMPFLPFFLDGRIRTQAIRR